MTPHLCLQVGEGLLLVGSQVANVARPDKVHRLDVVQRLHPGLGVRNGCGGGHVHRAECFVCVLCECGVL